MEDRSNLLKFLIHTLQSSKVNSIIGVKSRAYGIDQSYYEPTIDPSKAIPGLIDFDIIKATEGLTWKDTAFETLYPQTLKFTANGAYHYLRSQYSGAMQADWFLSVVNNKKFNILAIDFEGIGNTLNDAFVKILYDCLVKVTKSRPDCKVLLYSNPDLYDTVIYPAAIRLWGRDVFRDWDFWVAQYYYIVNPDGNPSMPLKRSDWKLWQFSDAGKPIEHGTTGYVDRNVFNGTLLEFNKWLDITGDIISYPFPGFDGTKRISGTRSGWEFELFISDPNRIKVSSVCLSPIESVSSVAKRLGARLAVNGGEWDRQSSTKDYTVSNGNVCHPRVTAAPSLMVLQNNSIVIDHKPTTNVREALSGLRYLIENGVISPTLYDNTQAQNTEGHARSVHGVMSNGYHMVLQSRGIHPTRTEFDGLLLREVAEIMKQYGAVKAFDSGGGGDVTCVLNYTSIIEPENVDPDSGLHFERPLPNVLLFFPNGGTMTTRYEAIAIGDKTRLRPNHNTDNTYIQSYPHGTLFHGDYVFEATQELRNASGVLIQKIGDKWLSVTDVDGVAKSGWVTITNMGIPYCTLADSGTTPPPPPPSKVHSFDLHWDVPTSTARWTVVREDGTSEVINYPI